MIVGAWVLWKSKYFWFVAYFMSWVITDLAETKDSPSRFANRFLWQILYRERTKYWVCSIFVGRLLYIPLYKSTGHISSPVKDDTGWQTQSSWFPLLEGCVNSSSTSGRTSNCRASKVICHTALHEACILRRTFLSLQRWSHEIRRNIGWYRCNLRSLLPPL